LKIDFFFLDLSSITLLTFVSIVLGILIVVAAKKFSKERTKIKYFYVAYILFYWFLFGLWWSSAFLYKLTGRKIKWGKKQ